MTSPTASTSTTTATRSKTSSTSGTSTTEIVNPASFLYNSGPIDSLESPNLNVRQTYTLSEGRGGVLTEIASGLMTPPVNIGPKSTPDYEALAAEAIADVGDGIKVFAGQRDDPFWVDLGGIGDLLTIRELPGNAGGGVDDLAGLNVPAAGHPGADRATDQRRPGAGRRRSRQRGDRRLDDGAAAVDDGPLARRHLGIRAPGAGFPARHAAGERGRGAARREGPLQLLASGQRRPVPGRGHRSGDRQAAQPALRRRAGGGAGIGAGGPGHRLPDRRARAQPARERHPQRDAAPQRRHPAGRHGQPARRHRRRQRRASPMAAGSKTRWSISSCAWRRASSSARSSRMAPTASSATACPPTTCRSWRSSPTWAPRTRASSTSITA